MLAANHELPRPPKYHQPNLYHTTPGKIFMKPKPRITKRLNDYRVTIPCNLLMTLPVRDHGTAVCAAESI